MSTINAQKICVCVSTEPDGDSSYKTSSRLQECPLKSWPIMLYSGLHPILHISATSWHLPHISIGPFKENLHLSHMWSSLRLRTIYYISRRRVNLLENQFHLFSNDSWDSQEGLTNLHWITDFIHFILSFWWCSLTEWRRDQCGDLVKAFYTSTNIAILELHAVWNSPPCFWKKKVLSLKWDAVNASVWQPLISETSILCHNLHI